MTTTPEPTESAPERSSHIHNPNPAGQDSKSWPRRLLDGARYTAAAVLVVWGSLSVIPNPIRDVETQCSTATMSSSSGQPQVTSSETTTTCNPPGISILLPYILGAAILVLPDFGELAIPGLLTLKRRVAEQENRLDQQEIRQKMLMSSVLANQMHQSFDIHLGEVRNSIRAKEEQMLEVGGSEAQDTIEDRRPSDARDQLLSALRSAAGELEELYNKSKDPSELSEQVRRRLVKWTRVFQAEILQLLSDAERARANPYNLDLGQLSNLSASIERLVGAATVSARAT